MPGFRPLTLIAALLLAGSAAAQLVPEELIVENLPEKLPPHWVWVNDVAFFNMSDGRAYLIDADTGRFMGMVSGGYSHLKLGIDRRGDRFVVPGTYYSRGTRGERTDVLTFYSSKNLEPGAEIVLPPKKYSGLPFVGTSNLTDDGRFMIIYNFTPEQSVTVADLERKALVGEFETPGCALIYPVGPRRFMMQCGDGSMQMARLAVDGRVTLGGVSKPLWELDNPATERAVRISESRWMFFTFDSDVIVVDGSGDQPKVVEKWSLVGSKPDSWRLGGLQPSAYHAATGTLFVIMHQGGRETRKDPGQQVWVFDVRTHKQIRQIDLASPATSIAVSEDGKPLLYTAQFGVPTLHVYDVTSGQKLRSIDQLGQTLTYLQPAPVGQ